MIAVGYIAAFIGCLAASCWLKSRFKPRSYHIQCWPQSNAIKMI